MLGLLNTSTGASSSQRQDQDQEEEEPLPPDLHNNTSAPPGIHMRQLVITCAELVSRSDFGAAHRLLTYLTANTSPLGDSMERLVHQFSKALSLRLNRTFAAPPPPQYHIHNTDNNNCYYTTTRCTLVEQESCYLSLNQITPFIRFSHLTANQAILEALQFQQVGQGKGIHILDLDIMHGLQWPPLMQALSDPSQYSQPAPTLRITGGGQDLTRLRRTGERLLKFAQSLGLRFHFQPLVLLNVNDLIPSSLSLLPDEALAVNCILYLHRLLLRGPEFLRIFLRNIKALNPRVVTVAEREGNHDHHNQPVGFLRRFMESLDHYSAIFESLEATLPPNSRERFAVEQLWFGREISEIVAGEGEGERHQTLEWWETMLRSSGFVNVRLSPFAFSQAKLLLRLHYPCEGYQLQTHNNSFFLGWQNRPLYSVSSWH